MDTFHYDRPNWMTAVKVALPFAFSALWIICERFWFPLPPPSPLSLGPLVFLTLGAWVVGAIVVFVAFIPIAVIAECLPDNLGKKLADNTIGKLDEVKFSTTFLIAYFVGLPVFLIGFIYRSPFAPF
jgi:hypothetical protein